MCLSIAVAALLIVFALGLGLGHQIGATQAVQASDENWEGVEF
jgi:hypothetical protein